MYIYIYTDTELFIQKYTVDNCGIIRIDYFMYIYIYVLYCGMYLCIYYYTYVYIYIHRYDNRDNIDHIDNS